MENKSKRKGFADLKKEVIDTGLCTLCGACAGVCPSQSIVMQIENLESDEPRPTLIGNCANCSVCYNACAGKHVPLADLDKFVFGRERNPLEEPIGIYRRTLKGYAASGLRDITSAGGVTMGVMQYALAEGVIDAAIVGVRNPEHPWRVEPSIITSPEQASSAVRSVLEAFPVNAILHEAVINRGFKKIALVGMPCQIHSIRKIQMLGIPKKIADAVVFNIGLYCNSTSYYIGVEHVLKEVGGIENFREIVSIDTRAGGWPGAMMVVTKDGKIRYVGTKGLFGSFTTYYRRDRCLMCIDFSSELADISAGDIFQVGPGHDPRWTGIITRTAIGDQVIDGAVKKGYIHIEPHDAEMIPASGFGWEMSKHSGMYHWIKRNEYGIPVPDFQYPPGIKLMRRTLDWNKS